MKDEHQDFLAELGADDRILRNSIPLPADGPIDPATIARVRKIYDKHTNTNGIFFGEIANAIGEQAAKISRWFNGEDDPVITRKLNAWLEADARRRAAKVASGLVTTAVAERIKLGANMATTAGAIVVLVAPAGCGKSMVLQHLAERTGGGYIYCSEVFGSRAFLQRICRAVGASFNGSRADLLSQAVERLAGTNRPLFFDEAHRLPADAIAAIRSLHDLAENLPMILAGTHDLIRQIDDRAGGAGQMASRCITLDLTSQALDATSPDGAFTHNARPLFTRQEIVAFLNHQGLRLADDDALAFAWSLACLPTHGCLRTLGRVVRLLRPNRDKAAEPITRRELRQALALIFSDTAPVIARQADRHIELAAKAG